MGLLERNQLRPNRRLADHNLNPVLLRSYASAKMTGAGCVWVVGVGSWLGSQEDLKL